jgi:hypothetical protein
MPKHFPMRSLRRLHVAVFVVCLAPSAVIAQESEGPPDTVQVALAGYTLAPELTETGMPVLDDAGEPVMLRVPLDASVITPGDQVLYVISVENPTSEGAANLQLGVQVAAELMLDPYSFVGPEGLVIDWANLEAPDTFAPLFVEIGGETVMQADLDTLRALRLTLPDLPPAEDFSVEYTATLR